MLSTMFVVTPVIFKGSIFWEERERERGALIVEVFFLHTNNNAKRQRHQTLTNGRASRSQVILTSNIVPSFSHSLSRSLFFSHFCWLIMRRCKIYQLLQLQLFLSLSSFSLLSLSSTFQQPTKKML